MRSVRSGTAARCFALVLSAVAAAAGAQSRPSQRAPSIRVYSENGAYVVQTTSYVMPAIEVSENAYVFVVSMDLNGQIQVLHPDAPGISVRILGRRPLKLPNFFTGYPTAAQGGQAYSSAGYTGYDANGYVDTRGTIIALASRAPFNLDLITSGGDWNMSALRQLIEGRTPFAAGQALAAYLGAKGETIGYDSMRFSGEGQSQYYAVDTSPIVAYGPTTSVHRTPFPHEKRPRSPGDTTVFAKYRFPQGWMPGDQAANTARPAAEGVFPQQPRAGLAQRGDPRIIYAPAGGRSDAQTIFSQSQPQPAAISAGQRQAPIDRSGSQPQAATGVMPTRELRAPPRVIIASPQPAHSPPSNRR